MFYGREPHIGNCGGHLPIGREGDRGGKKEPMKCLGVRFTTNTTDLPFYRVTSEPSVYALFVSVT